MNHVLAGDEISYEGPDLEALMILRRYRRWILDCFLPQLERGHAIEFGAGVGHMAELFLPYVDNLELIEPSPNLVVQLHERFLDDPRVKVHKGTLEERIYELRNDAYDSTILVNVLEHVEDDTSALTECFRILKPGGHLFLFVPALQALFSEIDRIHGHFRRYDHGDLMEKLGKAGFEITAFKFFDFLGIFPWWLMNRVLGATKFNPALVGLYDHLCVPVTRRMETVVTPPVGKNLVAVVRRPL